MKVENNQLPKISVIIPTCNEATNLPLLLSDLSILDEDGEIIIMDAASEDKTIEIANIYGARIYKSNKKNRGLQLNSGAKKARGEWFIFLHADSRLDRNWLRKIRPVFFEKELYVYYFKFKINDQKIIYRFLEILVNFRSYFLKTPYGDQGLLINRKTSRKWEKTDIFLQAIKNWKLRRRWRRGESIQKIYRDYYKK